MIESCALVQVAGAAIMEKDLLIIFYVTTARMISTVA